MANLNDIAALADSLEKQRIAVRQERCVRVRNRHASCRRCLDACPADALAIEGNRVAYAASLCTACGACTAVCPTEALLPLEPAEAALREACDRAAARADGTVAIACARIASKHGGDPDKYAEVPCLGRVDESLMLQAAASGASRLVLVDGDCPTCRYGPCGRLAAEAAEDAAAIIAACASGFPIERMTGFPPELALEAPEGRFGTDRRGFFSETAAAVKETTLTAARTTLNQKLGGAAAEEGLGQRLRVGSRGSLPQYPMARRDAALDAIDALGLPAGDSVGKRLFGSVAVDTSLCNGCGMCATFCPAGALRRVDGPDGKTLAALEFLASDCVGCGLCADVCWKDALVMSHEVAPGQLFSFEPVAFPVDPANRASGPGLGKSFIR